jgi:hypothetical protein
MNYLNINNKKIIKIKIEDYINKLSDNITIIDICNNKNLTYIPDLSKFKNIKMFK